VLHCNVLLCCSIETVAVLHYCGHAALLLQCCGFAVLLCYSVTVMVRCCGITLLLYCSVETVAVVVLLGDAVVLQSMLLWYTVVVLN